MIVPYAAAVNDPRTCMRTTIRRPAFFVWPILPVAALRHAR